MKPAPVRLGGYTIFEVMIFLIISSVLVLSVISLFTGRIQRNEFAQSVQALDSRIRSVANEAASGTYPDTPPFSCTIVNNRPVPSSLGNTSDQGTRKDCTFAGKIINFDVKTATCTSVTTSTGCNSIDVYTVVGRRIVPSTGQVPQSLLGGNGAAPTVVQDPNITQSYDLGYGAHVSGLYLKPDANSPADLSTPLSAVGFFQSFNASYNGVNLNSSAQNIQTWYVKSTINAASPLPLSYIAGAVNSSLLYQAPSGTLVVCVKSGSSNQNASITFGDSNNALTTTTKIEDPQCP